MKITVLIVRNLLGLVFLVFGLNGFFHFIPLPPPTSPLAGQFMGAIVGSGYFVVIFALQAISGPMLLANRYVPLALTLLGPVLVNILCFHAFMAPEGLPLPLILTIFWGITAFYHRSAFAGLFQGREVPSIVN